MKIGLVSFEIILENSKKDLQSDPEISRQNTDIVVRIIKEHTDLDMLVFSGHTLVDESELNKFMKVIDGFQTPTLVLFEIWNPSLERGMHRPLALYNGQLEDRKFSQLFVTGKEANQNPELIERLLGELLEKRAFKVNGKIVRWLICGENNILQNLKKDEWEASFRLSENEILNAKFSEIIKQTDIFINPTHSFMGNQGKLSRRRALLSSNNRIYCSSSNADISAWGQSLHGKRAQYFVSNGQELDGEKIELNEERCLFKVYSL